MHELRTSVSAVGQPYVDKPVYVRPKSEKAPSMLALSITLAFNGGVLPRGTVKEPILVRHERYRLRWKTPDGKGGLRPMNKYRDRYSEDRGRSYA